MPICNFKSDLACMDNGVVKKARGGHVLCCTKTFYKQTTAGVCFSYSVLCLGGKCPQYRGLDKRQRIYHAAHVSAKKEEKMG